MPVPSQVLRDASEVRYYTALGWQHVNTMFSSQISWKKLSRKVMYTARCAGGDSGNQVLRNRGFGARIRSTVETRRRLRDYAVYRAGGDELALSREDGLREDGLRAENSTA